MNKGTKLEMGRKGDKNTKELLKRFKIKAQLMDKTIALQTELEGALDLICGGLLLLRQVKNVDSVNYSYLNCLSNGFERLIKIAIIGLHVEQFGIFPENNAIIKGSKFKSGHEISLMFTDVFADIHSRCRVDLSNEFFNAKDLATEYFNLLENFATSHRYGNIDKICAKDPLDVNNNVFGRMRCFISKFVDPNERLALQYEAEDLLALSRFIQFNKNLIEGIFSSFYTFKKTPWVWSIATKVKAEIDKIPCEVEFSTSLNTFVLGPGKSRWIYWKLKFSSRSIRISAQNFPDVWPFTVTSLNFLKYQKYTMLEISGRLYGVNGISQRLGVPSYFKAPELISRRNAVELIQFAKSELISHKINECL